MFDPLYQPILHQAAQLLATPQKQPTTQPVATPGQATPAALLTCSACGEAQTFLDKPAHHDLITRHWVHDVDGWRHRECSARVTPAPAPASNYIGEYDPWDDYPDAPDLCGCARFGLHTDPGDY